MGTETVAPLSPSHVVVVVVVVVEVTDFLQINPKFQALAKGALLLPVVAALLPALFSVTGKKRMHNHLPILLEHVLTCAQVNILLL